MNVSKFVLIRVILLAFLFAENMTGQCEEVKIKWREAGPLTNAEKEKYELKAWEFYKLARKSVADVSEVVGVYKDNKDYPSLIRKGIPSISIIFKGEAVCCEVELLTHDFYGRNKDAVASFKDHYLDKKLALEGREMIVEANEKREREGRIKPVEYYIPRAREIKDIVKKAEEYLHCIDGVDFKKWQFLACGNLDPEKQWAVSFAPKIEGYLSRFYGMSVYLANNENLDLVSYHGGRRELPKPVNLSVNISQKKAKELSDEYLKKYYYKHELDTLDFQNIKLEVIIPNYEFISKQLNPQGTTNAPTLGWVSTYVRNNKTITKTPVEVYIDAGDGSMLGGFE